MVSKGGAWARRGQGKGSQGGHNGDRVPGRGTSPCGGSRKHVRWQGDSSGEAGIINSTETDRKGYLMNLYNLFFWAAESRNAAVSQTQPCSPGRERDSQTWRLEVGKTRSMRDEGNSEKRRGGLLTGRDLWGRT